MRNRFKFGDKTGGWNFKECVTMGHFEPAWMTSDNEKALKGVGRLNNQKKLEHAALFALSGEARELAIKRLTDQARLANVANHATHADVCRAARELTVSKITDQKLLAGVAKNARCSNVRKEAFEKLTDQEALADIALYGKDKDMRGQSVDKLDDQGILADIAKPDGYCWKCKAAFLLAAGESAIFANIAVVAGTEESLQVRRMAVRKLADQGLLADIAKNDKDAGIRMCAAEKLADNAYVQEIYADIARSARNPRDMMYKFDAALNLADETLAQEAFAEIALLDDIFNDKREAAIMMVKDKSILKERGCDKGNHFGKKLSSHSRQDGGTHTPVTAYKCIVCGEEYAEEGDSWW